MNKAIKVYALIWAIAVCLFHVVVFLIPNDGIGEGNFWTGYIFISIAFIGQLACTCVALQERNTTVLLYKTSAVLVSYIGLFAMLVVGFLTIASADIPIWLGIVICFAVLCIMLIVTIAALFNARVVADIDKKGVQETYFIKKLISDAESVVAIADTDSIKKDAKAVYDKVRYSDPVSKANVIEINERIQRQFMDFRNAVELKDEIRTAEASTQLIALIDERSSLCKLSK